MAGRQKSGLSTRELAAAVGLSYNTVYRIERGDYPLRRPAAVKAILHLISLDDLLLSFANHQFRNCPELLKLEEMLREIRKSEKPETGQLAIPFDEGK
ncbi:MAG: helix-turn-helix domain-containing protein [Candidatus Saccharibacteria bacterium]